MGIKIYKSFDEAFADFWVNKRHEGDTPRNCFKAAWDARQTEIDALKEEIESLKYELSQSIPRP